LLKSIKNYFNGNNTKRNYNIVEFRVPQAADYPCLRPNRDLADFLIQKFSEIVEKIIPFFDKYSVLGAKALSYVAFKKVASIMQKKEHLSEPRLSEILSSKSFT